MALTVCAVADLPQPAAPASAKLEPAQRREWHQTLLAAQTLAKEAVEACKRINQHTGADAVSVVRGLVVPGVAKPRLPNLVFLQGRDAMAKKRLAEARKLERVANEKIWKSRAHLKEIMLEMAGGGKRPP